MGEKGKVRRLLNAMERYGGRRRGCQPRKSKNGEGRQLEKTTPLMTGGSKKNPRRLVNRKGLGGKRTGETK